jgi:hypothetical protein
MPAGSNKDSIQEVSINNDGIEGPSLTIVYAHPTEFKDADSLLISEIRSITAPLSVYHPRLIGLKNVLAARLKGIDADETQLKGRVIINLPFKANRQLSDISVEEHISNPSIFMITLKKLDESFNTDITSLVKSQTPIR